MMLTDGIKEKIQELFQATPSDINVAYGKKMTNGEFTGQVGIVFYVEKKLPSEAIDEGQLLPSSVIIDDIEYVTDVIEVGKITTLVCDPVTTNNCYAWQNPETPPDNRYSLRPLLGGLSINSYNKVTSSTGTLGLIAVDSTTNALVGVTCSHVVVSDNFYTSDRNLNGIVQNELYDTIYQNGEIGLPRPLFAVGQVMRYVPWNLTSSNQVDVAIFSVNAEDISNTESFKQLGLSYNLPMPFASTEELNNLLSTDPSLYSSGRTSGAKGEGVCGLVISGIGLTFTVYGGSLQGVPQDVTFTNCMTFTRTNPDCLYPITGGDSGSALIASFGGVWKIIGIVFAGGGIEGIACRIDDVAAQIGISAWDGTPKNYINPATKEYKTTSGGSSDKLLTCDGSTYWQVGLVNESVPCNPVTTTTTTTQVQQTTTTTTTPVPPTTTTTTTFVGPTTTTTTTSTVVPTTTTTTTIGIPTWYTMTSCIDGYRTLKSSVYSAGTFTVGQTVLLETDSSFATITGSLSVKPSGILDKIFAVNVTGCPTIIGVNVGATPMIACDENIALYLEPGINTGATILCNADTLYTNFDLFSQFFSGTVYVSQTDIGGSYRQYTISQDGKSATAVGPCMLCGGTTTTIPPTTTTTTTFIGTTTTTTTFVPGSINSLYMGHLIYNTTWITFD